MARHHRRAGNEGREQRKCHKEIARPAESRSAAKKTCELIERQSKGERVQKFVDIHFFCFSVKNREGATFVRTRSRLGMGRGGGTRVVSWTEGAGLYGLLSKKQTAANFFLNISQKSA